MTVLWSVRLHNFTNVLTNFWCLIFFFPILNMHVTVTAGISKSSQREYSGSDVSSSTADVQQADRSRYHWITAWPWISYLTAQLQFLSLWNGILMFNYLNKPAHTDEYWKGHGTSMLEIQVVTWELPFTKNLTLCCSHSLKKQKI